MRLFCTRMPLRSPSLMEVKVSSTTSPSAAYLDVQGISFIYSSLGQHSGRNFAGNYIGRRVSLIFEYE